MIVPTERRGLSDAYGSWKIICTSRRSGLMRRSGQLLMSLPSYTIEPDVGASSRVSSRAVVDLPQPLSPTRPNVSPRRTSNEIPSTACTRATSRWSSPLRIGKYFTRSLTTSICSPAGTSTSSCTTVSVLTTAAPDALSGARPRGAAAPRRADGSARDGPGPTPRAAAPSRTPAAARTDSADGTCTRAAHG